jgi:Bacteriophage probable baseplate hub protein
MASSLISPGLPTDYYAPDFKVEVEGAELDPTAKGDVLDLKVVMDIDNMTSAQLSVSNWDDRALTFKYSDTRTFDLGARVHVQLGYANRLRSMLRGQVTALSPKFPESGQPTLDVTVLDGMMKLKDRKPAEGERKQYENLADWEIAQEIGQRNHMDVTVTEQGETHALVVQKNQSDAAFLMERAKRIDFDCFVLTDPVSGRDRLHFVRPTDARDATRVRVYTFRWGASLLSFAPTLTLAKQVASVTVRGWDPGAKEAITYKATAADLPGSPQGGGTSGPEAADQTMGGKEEVVVDAPVLTQEEAKELAISLLRERAYEFVTGTGRVIGIPDLRPGDNVDIDGLGRRFSGRYYVKRVEHSLGGSGYTTQFDGRRVYDGGVQ